MKLVSILNRHDDRYTVRYIVFGADLCRLRRVRRRTGVYILTLSEFICHCETLLIHSAVTRVIK